jgi:hypothetical protein
MIEWLLLTLLIVHVVGFWLLVFRVIRLRRQIRCLHYCFVSISDWGIESVKEVVNYYIEQDGRDNSPFLDLEENWGTKIDHYYGMLKRARVHIPANHYDYVLEDK